MVNYMFLWFIAADLTIWKRKHLCWYITSVHSDWYWDWSSSMMAISTSKQHQKNECHRAWSKNTPFFTHINGYWPTYTGMLYIVKTLAPSQPRCLSGWHPLSGAGVSKFEVAGPVLPTVVSNLAPLRSTYGSTVHGRTVARLRALAVMSRCCQPKCSVWTPELVKVLVP